MFNRVIPTSYLVGQLTISSHMFFGEIHDCKSLFWWVKSQYILIFLVNFIPLKTQFYCSCHNFILFNGMITTMLQTSWVPVSELGRYKGKWPIYPSKGTIIYLYILYVPRLFQVFHHPMTNLPSNMYRQTWSNPYTEAALILSASASFTSFIMATMGPSPRPSRFTSPRFTPRASPDDHSHGVESARGIHPKISTTYIV